MNQGLKMGTLNVVGIGPGDDSNLTPAALEAIRNADHVIGYTTYIRLIKQHITGKDITRTGMSEEIGRARVAIELAKEGKNITLISSGDSGVYGMAGLIFDCLKEIGWKRGDSPKLNIVPGISAANSCGSLVGAPLIHDSCTISLSDLLTPWPVIEKRIENAAQGDFVISFYNPASGRRQRQIVEAKNIISKYRPGSTPVALVKSAYRKRQEITMTNLDNFLDYEIGMLTTVIVGSTQSYVYEGYMVTPRGHVNKYDLESGAVKKGQRKTISLSCEGDLKSKIDLKSADVQLANTYVTPAENWVTPKDVNDKTFLSNDESEIADASKSNRKASSEMNALKALELLADNTILTSSNKTLATKELKTIQNQKDYSVINQFFGVLYIKTNRKEYFVGDFKEPVDLDKHDVKILNEDKNGKIKEIRTSSSIGTPLFLWPSIKENQVEDIYDKFVIYRNHSVSKRLKTSVQDSSTKVKYGNDIIHDACWLANTPMSMWTIIRDSVLKC